MSFNVARTSPSFSPYAAGAYSPWSPQLAGNAGGAELFSAFAERALSEAVSHFFGGNAGLQNFVGMFANSLMQSMMNGGAGRDLGGGFGTAGSWGGAQRVSSAWRPQNGVLPGGTASGQNLAQAAERTANTMGSTGLCYRGVKRSVAQATGVQLTGTSAYQAAGQLANSGRFREVNVGQNQLRNLPPGAVVVWGRTPQSRHGHISVALGGGREASDHVQRQITSLRGASNYRVFVPNQMA
jgi:hypothetical protein